MPDLSAEFKDAATQQREPTKLECGLLGALAATIALAILFWLSVQLSLVQLALHFH